MAELKVRKIIEIHDEIIKKYGGTKGASTGSPSLRDGGGQSW